MASDLEQVRVIIGKLRECGVPEEALKPAIRWYEEQSKVRFEDWLEAQHKMALRSAEKSNPPEQALYYARAKAFEDVIRYMSR